MARSPVRSKNLFLLIFSFIFVLHTVALILKLNLEEQRKKEETPITVKLLTDKEFRKQIVQSADSENREVKKDAFLSDKTRSFDRQTRSRVVDTFQPENSSGSPKKSRKDVKLSDLGKMVAKDPFKESAKEYTKQKNSPGNKGTGRKVSSTNDYLEEIPLGDTTYLNTVEYKYYGFYHRIRQKLEQFWGRSIQEKASELAKSGRQVASSDQFVTALVIVLDGEGEILSIKVKGSSGVKELDDAAIESFNEAGPFPNPPKDLIVDGRVTLEWGFVVNS